MNESETSQMAATKTKLNKLKEKEMKTEFMDKLGEYINNMDYFKQILEFSNPMRMIGYYQNHSYYAKGNYKFDSIHENIINEKNYCDMTDIHFLFSFKQNKKWSFYTDFAEEGDYLMKKFLVSRPS